MPSITYPYDPLGTAPSNLIEGELHTLTEINAAPYRILIPTFAPLYLNNLLLEHVAVNGEVSELHEGEDYYATLPYMAASRSLGQPVYGGLALISTLPQGTVRLRYQTVGGEWCADQNTVYNNLLTIAYNQRLTWWDQITNVQQTFPPSNHQNSAGDVAGHEDLLAAMNQIIAAILTPRNNDVPASYVAHLLATGNAHGATPADFGLEHVQNIPPATDEEVMARAMVDKTVTLRQIVMLLNSI